MTGVAFLSFFGSIIKRWNWQMTSYTFVMVFFGSLLALATPERKSMMIACLFLSQAGYSASIYLCIAVSQMGVEQRDLGISGGISGTSRFADGAIATAVYTTVLSNTVKKWTVRLVPPAPIAAGLPAGNVTALMEEVGTAVLAENFSPTIVAELEVL